MNCLAILVNYHGADLLLQAAASLADEPACTSLQVVDNSVCAQQARRLREGLPPRAGLTVSEHNRGFAGACNLAFDTHGATADCVLLLNPDARLLPGALAQMKATLAERPDAGAVGPRVFWDEAGRFMLPPPTAPTPFAHLCRRLGQHSSRLRRWHTRRWRAHALALWQAAAPLSVAALSGGHVLLRTAALRSAGGLFDPAFFMYWEDSDLMRRLHRAGWRLLIDPRAHAIHAYEHSAHKDDLLAHGWPVYARKHFSGLPWRGLDALLRRCPPAAPPEAGWPRVRADGEAALAVPEALRSGWLLEVAVSPDFVPAIGHLGHGAAARPPLALLRRLGQRPLYLRLSSRAERSPGDCRHWVLLPAAEGH